MRLSKSSVVRVVRTSTMLVAYSVLSELTALSSSDFTEQWRHSLDHEFPVHEAPDVDVALVWGLRGQLGAFDARGERLWTRTDAGQTSATWRHHVVLLAGRTLIWLDAATGTAADTMELPFEGSGLVVWEDMAVVSERDGDSFCGVHLPRRQVVWTRPLRLELSTRFGIEDPGRFFTQAPGSGEPFVGYLWESKRLIALDLETGEPRWSQSAFLLNGPHCVLDGRVYYWPWTPRRSSHLIALDQRTGDVIYDVDLGSVHEQLRSPCRAWCPAVVGDSLVYTTEDGVGVVARRRDGLVAGYFRRGYAFSAPAAVGREVAVGTADGYLLTFPIRDVVESS
jgi:outer membrane protein assembly factor BamB